MTVPRPRRKTAMIALVTAAALLPALVTAPMGAAAIVPSNLAQAEARAIEFQRIGFLPDVQEQLQHIAATDPAEGAAFAAATEFWNSSLSNFQVTGATNATDPAGIPDGLPNQRSHVFVVLGHVLNDDGTPQQQLLDRVEVAKTAAAKYPNARIMVTGGQPRNGHTEGQVMHDLLVAGGIAEDRIIVENQSSDTPDNATMSMAILYGATMTGADRVDSVSLITASWHMRRGTVLYHYATELARARNNYDHLIEVKQGAACMTSACQNSGYVNPPGYPGKSERNLIAQNVAKIAGSAVGGSDGNGGEIATFRTGTGGLRRAIAKFVYFQREGFAGNDVEPRNNVADVRRVAAEAGDVSNVLGKELLTLNAAWDDALRPITYNTTIPTLPNDGAGHAFVVLGNNGGSGTRTQGRIAATVAALNHNEAAIAIVSGSDGEIAAAYNGIVGQGIDPSRVIRPQGSGTEGNANAQTGSFLAVNELYALGNITDYTLVSSRDYVRRPMVLFAASDLLRRGAWGSPTRIRLAGNLVETISGAEPESALPDAAARNQIIDNVDDLFDISSGNLAEWNSPAPAASILLGLPVTAPAKTEYLVGEPFDRAGFQVFAELDNGTIGTVDVTDLATITEPSTTQPGEFELTASYSYRGVTRLASTDITVRAANVDSLESAVTAAEQIDPAEYTTESFAALTAAITAANAVIVDLGSTAQDVAEALTALESARDGLVVRRPTSEDPEPAPPTTAPPIQPAPPTSKVTAKVKVKRIKGKAKRGGKITVRVRVVASRGIAPTGRVTIKLKGKTVGKAKLRKAGKFYQAKIKTKKLTRKGKLKVTYAGNTTYAKRTVTSKIKIR